MSQLQVTGEAKIRDIQGPVVANSGVITALDGAASQYVRGDGTLADFPTSSGGGSSVSYYLNSSVSQGTIGGVAYRELSKEPIIGAGTDIAIAANGYVASYLTDANDPDVLSIPGGNFNCEFYFSVSNDTGNPFFYAELYKYDGTTFTLLGSSVGVPEYINQGTIIAPYYFAIPVPTSALAVTDRLAIRIYVNVDGRTVTLHTENSHLCQVVTTLSKGMVSLNNLTDQSQYLTTGTSGTNFAIVSSGDTHTFNLPIASATNTGKLSSTDWSTFNNKVPYTGATANVDLGSFELNAILVKAITLEAKLNGTASGNLVLRTGTNGYGFGNNAFSLASSPDYDNTLLLISNKSAVTKTALFNINSLTADRTYTFPNATGTIALTSDLNSYVPYTGATASVNLGGNSLSASALTVATNLILNSTFLLKKAGLGTTTPTYVSQFAATTGVGIGYSDGTGGGNFIFPTASINDYTYPAITGTLALLEGTQTFSGSKTFSTGIKAESGIFLKELSSSGRLTGYVGISATATGGMQQIQFLYPVSGSSVFSLPTTGAYNYEFPIVSGTIALTSDLSSYVPYTGATTNVNLGVYSLTANQLIAGGANIDNVATFSTYDQGHALKLKGSTGDLFFVPYFSPSIGARITAQNSAASANTPLSFYASNFYFNSNVNFGSTLGNGTYTYTLPSATGTLALTSNLSAYLPLTGGTLTGALSGTSATFTSGVFNNGTNSTNGIQVISSLSGSLFTGGIEFIRTTVVAGSKIEPFRDAGVGGVGFKFLTTANNSAEVSGTYSTVLTILNTGAATFSSSVTVPSITNAGSFKMDYGSNASSRSWRIISDSYNFGDFSIQQSTTQAGSTYADRLLISANGNVGIGTSSPNARLSLGTGTTSKLLVYDGGTIAQGGNGFFAGFAVDYPSGNDFGMFAHNNGALVFGKYTNNNDLNNVTERMRITSGGDISFNGGSASSGNSTSTPKNFRFNNDYSNGTTDASLKLYLFNEGATIQGLTSGPSFDLQYHSSGNNTTGQHVWYIGNTQVMKVQSTSGNVTIASLGTGTVTATSGTLSTVSDMNLKNEDGFINNALDKVLKLKPRYYHWKQESGLPTDLRQLGFYAQEVNEALGEEAANTPKTENDKWGIYDRGMIAFLTAAIQEQQVQIEELKQLIKNK